MDFTDPRINNGAVTRGFMEVVTRLTALDNPSIELVRLIFDNSSVNLAVGNIDLNTDYDEFVPGNDNGGDRNAAKKAKLKRQIKGLTKQIKKAKKKGKKSTVRKLSKKLKRLKKQLRAL